MAFKLHPQLENDCIFVRKLQLSRILLMNDSQFPWFILVPEIEGISEIYQLDKQQQLVLMEESSLLAALLSQLYTADKMNIAAIGNLVPQLHIHHVVRYRRDALWPAPVWGKLPAIPYMESEITAIIRRITENIEAITASPIPT